MQEATLAVSKSLLYGADEEREGMFNKKAPQEALNHVSRTDLECLAERTGLEPATPGVTGRYSNQLNYRSAAVKTKTNQCQKTGVP